MHTPDTYHEPLRTRVMYVAERGDEVVGFGQLDPAVGEIQAVYIRPEVARTGVGSALLARLEEVARERGLDRLELSSTLNAQMFYEKRGFRVLGPARHVLQEDLALECLRMEKRLDPA